MKPQKTLSCQTILRKKNQSENIILSDFGLYHKAIVMEQHGTGTKTDTQLKQNIEPRKKPMHLWSISLQQNEARIYSGKKTVSSTGSAVKIEQLHIKE